VSLALMLAANAWTAGQSDAGATSERLTLTMFMSNAGVPHPEGLDPSDNWALKIVEDYANVDLILEVPAYQDFPTKLNLLLASGNLPDIVHGYSPTEMNQAADAGAFIDLKKLYDASPVMQKVVPAEALELARSPGGKYWAIPRMNSGQLSGQTNAVRLDLWEQYNGGKNPGTVEGWMDYLRWIKRTIPDSIPLTGRQVGENIWNSQDTFFIWYGVQPYRFRVQGGQVIHEFTLPAYAEAVGVFRQLYADGVLDKEFAANPTPQWVNKLYGRNVGMFTYPAHQILLNAASFNKNLGGGNKFWTMSPPLTTYPSVVANDLRYTYGNADLPIGVHRVGISSKSRYPDRAFKVLEGFASDALKDAMTWGREGHDYTVKDGQRVPDLTRIYLRDDKNPETMYWTQNMAFITGNQFFSENILKVVGLQIGTSVMDKIRGQTQWTIDRAKEVGVHISPGSCRSPASPRNSASPRRSSTRRWSRRSPARPLWTNCAISSGCSSSSTATWSRSTPSG
jgi:putative aldouronate transport system substrate-binding protein